MTSRLKHLISSVFLTAGLALTGCGTDTSPLASTDDTAFAAPQSRSTITLTTNGFKPAAKTAVVPAEGIANSKLIGPAGGEIYLAHFNGTWRLQDDIMVQFAVGQGALSASHTIDMTLYGNTLEEMVVEFTPSGLTFSPEATLLLTLGTDLVNTPIEQIQVWHEHGDGSVEEAYITAAYEAGPYVILQVKVPGFSKYSSGGGD